LFIALAQSKSDEIETLAYISVALFSKSKERLFHEVCPGEFLA